MIIIPIQARRKVKTDGTIYRNCKKILNTRNRPLCKTINEKIHPEPQTTTEFIETTTIANTDELITETTTTTTKETTEKTTKEATEKTTKETTESTTSRSQKVVYGSRTGNHYHLGGCRYANGAKMTVAEAERKGWEPCAVCNP